MHLLGTSSSNAERQSVGNEFIRLWNHISQLKYTITDKKPSDSILNKFTKKKKQMILKRTKTLEKTLPKIYSELMCLLFLKMYTNL